MKKLRIRCSHSGCHKLTVSFFKEDKELHLEIQEYPYGERQDALFTSDEIQKLFVYLSKVWEHI